MFFLKIINKKKKIRERVTNTQNIIKKGGRRKPKNEFSLKKYKEKIVNLSALLHMSKICLVRGLLFW